MSGNYSLLILVLFPFVGAVLTYIVGKKDKTKRDLTALVITMVEFVWFFVLLLINLAAQQDGGSRQMYFSCAGFGLGLNLCLDGFRSLYGLIAVFMWMMTTLFSRQYFEHYRNRNRYYFFLLMTLGATLGVFLSADLYTTFLFFEIMSFTSYVWVAHDETKESLRAAETYLAVAVTGGLVMLMGLFLLYHMFGTLKISELGSLVLSWRENPDAVQPFSETGLYVAGGCLLFGFGAKAGAFPLHIWLPKAHPAAPAPASALLSGILTKTGIFGIIAVTVSLFLYDGKWGALILVLGIATMFIGALLAVFSINIKRTLACSSVSQIGFILTGIGMMVLLGTENAVAARGTLLHMVNHSLIKLVLFMAAGAIYACIHKLDLNEIRGFGHGKPLFHAVFLAGALGITGIPLFNGYISKTLLHESIVEYRHLLAGGHAAAAEGGLIGFFTGPVWMGFTEWIFLISGGMTVAYMLKLYVAIFLEKNTDAQVQKSFEEKKDSFLTKQSGFALAGSAVLLPILGILPHQVTDRFAFLGEGFLGSSGTTEQVSYFSLTNLQGTLISVVIGIAIYFLIVRPLLMKKEGSVKVYVDRWPSWLDLENLVYRPVMCVILPLIFGTVSRILDRLVDGIIVLLRKTVYKDSPIPHELEEGNQLTYTAGSFVDGVTKIFHSRTDYKHKFAILYEDFSENATIIGRSLSFGLFMACVGLILTLLYLLL